jgi:hypothetical protein
VALGSCVVALPFCRTQIGQPPLHAAVSHNQAAIVELLLQHGASMDTVWVRAHSNLKARCLFPWNAGMFVCEAVFAGYLLHKVMEVVHVAPPPLPPVSWNRPVKVVFQRLFSISRVPADMRT